MRKVITFYVLRMTWCARPTLASSASLQTTPTFIYGTGAMSDCTPIRMKNVCVILSDQRERRISRLQTGRFLSRYAPSE